MTEIIGAPTRFADALRRPDARGREVETAMALHLEPFVVRNRLGVEDIMRGLMGNIVAIVFAKASSFEDAKEAITQIASELERRVKQAPRR
jgi:hypothetical protein